jgi:ADP-ribosyl-[dinitrogen reductase] hydrolase
MLVEMAVGDAYGAGFEFKPQEFVNAYNNLSTYFPHGLAKDGPEGPASGLYTDDTQMTLAIMEAMLIDGPGWIGRTPPEESYIDFFIRCYQRDPRVGYSKRIQALLAESKSAEHFRTLVGPGSEGSGAAMRAIPAALQNGSEYIGLTDEIAKITHNTPAGIASARAVAIMARRCAEYGEWSMGHMVGNLKGLAEADLFTLLDPWPEDGPQVSSKGTDVVRAVITALESSRSMSEILQKGVSFGGDVDTVGAISMGIASLCENVENDLPKSLYDGLENGPFGIAYLDFVDRVFAAQYKFGYQKD